MELSIVSSQVLLLFQSYIFRRRDPTLYIEIVMRSPHLRLRDEEINFLDAVWNEGLDKLRFQGMKDIPERLRDALKKTKRRSIS
jgi:hypothetical protein